MAYVLMSHVYVHAITCLASALAQVCPTMSCIPLVFSIADHISTRFWIGDLFLWYTRQSDLGMLIYAAGFRHIHGFWYTGFWHADFQQAALPWGRCEIFNLMDTYEHAMHSGLAELEQLHVEPNSEHQTPLHCSSAHCRRWKAGWGSHTAHDEKLDGAGNKARVRVSRAFRACCARAATCGV